jgi:NAD(P)-dependent dehydrogenase (short-subunit alcohol dehydrogenase family)
MSGRLDGKLALVTGASRGIGAAVARSLARDGAHVVLTARTTGGLEDVEQAIHDAGGSATIAPLDLTDGDSIGRLATAVSGRWASLDVLVLNAAMLGALAPVPSIDPKEFARVLTLNVGAAQAMIAAFDPLLRVATSPRLIALTSKLGIAPRAYWGAYGASKAALDNLLLAYADEMENLVPALRVALVDPAKTRTRMRELAYPGEDPTTLKDPAIVGDAIAALVTTDYPTGHRYRVGD